MVLYAVLVREYFGARIMGTGRGRGGRKPRDGVSPYLAPHDGPSHLIDWAE
jgi:hypothetical protein